MNSIDHCSNLEPTPGGHSLINKITQERVATVFDLIDMYSCNNCEKRYHCKLLEILEASVCL